MPNRAVSGFFAALDVSKTILEHSQIISLNNLDQDIKSQMIIGNQVKNQVRIAYEKGMIPPKYQTVEGLNSILNWVLSGTSDMKNDFYISLIGQTIYNYFHQSPEINKVTIPSGLSNIPSRTITLPSFKQKDKENE